MGVTVHGLDNAAQRLQRCILRDADGASRRDALGVLLHRESLRRRCFSRDTFAASEIYTIAHATAFRALAFAAPLNGIYKRETNDATRIVGRKISAGHRYYRSVTNRGIIPDTNLMHILIP